MNSIVIKVQHCHYYKIKPQSKRIKRNIIAIYNWQTICTFTKYKHNTVCIYSLQTEAKITDKQNNKEIK